MACKFGNLKLVQYLISLCMIDINAKGILSNAIFYSVTTFCLSYFVSKKWPFLWNSKIIKIYATALHFACLSGNIDLVKYLIESQTIDIWSKDVYYYFFSSFILFLIKFLPYHLWYSKIFKIYRTILNYACKSGNLELIKYLIDEIKIDSENRDVLLQIYK